MLICTVSLPGDLPTPPAPVRLAQPGSCAVLCPACKLFSTESYKELSELGSVSRVLLHLGFSLPGNLIPNSSMLCHTQVALPAHHPAAHSETSLLEDHPEMSEDVRCYMAPRGHEGGEPHRYLWLHKVSHWSNFVPASPNGPISEELDLVLEDVFASFPKGFFGIECVSTESDSNTLYT